MPKMKTYHAILIGNGTMGTRHRSRFESRGVHFLQILDLADLPSFDIAEDVFRNVLDRNSIDFVVIASPAVTHYRYAAFFLKNRISVFVEKPLALNADEADTLLELSCRYKCLLFVAHSECYNPIFLRFRHRFLRHLQTNDIQSVRLSFRREHPYSKRCRDVGVALDLLVHDLSLFLTLFSFGNTQIQHFEFSEDAAKLSLVWKKDSLPRIVADFWVDRDSQVDVRTITVQMESGEKIETQEVSLAQYLSNGEILHIPDSLDNEQKFFLKLLGGSFSTWALKAAQIARDVVFLATLPRK